ncbi:MAG: SDR family NAD(P)-dependent oxidoreductase [Thermodesulfobacteriota bacterium]
MDHFVKGSVLITGASSGIGRTTAIHLDAHHYRVFAGVRNIADGEHLRAACSPWLTPVVMDITKPDEITRAVQYVQEHIEQKSGLIGLINNAGSGVGGPLEFLPIEDLRTQFEINVFGHIAVTQAFLPLLRQSRGRVINVGSMAGRVALPFSGPYASSKAALAALTDALRRELSWWNIPVVLMEIGSVKTPIWEKAFKEAEDRAATMPSVARDLYEKPLRAMNDYMKNLVRHATVSEKVATVIQVALESPKPRTRYFVGLDAYLGLFSRLLPDRALDWLLRKEQERRFSA